MRILIATGIYPPDIGGPATYSKLLKDELPKNGIDVDILSFGEVRHLPSVLRHIVYFLKVLNKGRKVDIIYAQDVVSVGWPTAFANIFLRRKFIVKIVGDHIWEQGTQRFYVKENLDDFKISIKKHHLYLYFLYILRKITIWLADRVVTPSNYLKSIVSSWGVNPDKITVVYNSFDIPDKNKFDNEVIKKEFNISGKTIISVGRLVLWKGFPSLIESFVQIKKEFSDTILLIVGDGPEEENLKKIINKNNLSNSVKLLGRLEREKLLALISVSDVFVLNTSYEGFSHQILEVLALSVPIITTPVGGNVEVIKDGKNGLLVPYNDVNALTIAVGKVLSDNSFTEKITKNGLSFVQNFEKSRMLEKITNILKSCIRIK